MGTLFQQRPRAEYDHFVSISEVECLVDKMQQIAKKYKVGLQDVLKAREILELERQNNLYRNNGDTFDEQMAGFGELLQELTETLSK